MSWFVERKVDMGSRSNYNCKNKSIVRGLAYHRKLYKLLTAQQKLGWGDHELHIEPWLREVETRRLLQPDAVLIDPITETGIVIEVKMNWKDGRDEKLIAEYIPAVESAYGLAAVWPALITGNVAGLKHNPLGGLHKLLDCVGWSLGQPTPVLLVP